MYIPHTYLSTCRVCGRGGGLLPALLLLRCYLPLYYLLSLVAVYIYYTHLISRRSTFLVAVPISLLIPHVPSCGLCPLQSHSAADRRRGQQQHLERRQRRRRTWTKQQQVGRQCGISRFVVVGWQQGRVFMSTGNNWPATGLHVAPQFLEEQDEQQQLQLRSTGNGAGLGRRPGAPSQQQSQ